jgi:hypothetical protein
MVAKQAVAPVPQPKQRMNACIIMCMCALYVFINNIHIYIYICVCVQYVDMSKVPLLVHPACAWHNNIILFKQHVLSICMQSCWRSRPATTGTASTHNTRIGLQSLSCLIVTILNRVGFSRTATGCSPSFRSCYHLRSSNACNNSSTFQQKMVPRRE